MSDLRLSVREPSVISKNRETTRTQDVEDSCNSLRQWVRATKTKKVNSLRRTNFSSLIQIGGFFLLHFSPEVN